MAISPTDQEKIKKHLEGKLKACPMCLTDKWILESEAVSVPVWEPPLPPAPGVLVGGRMDLERTMPLVAVSCANCRLTLFYPWGSIVGGLDG
jgi:hypothetical protein